VLEFDPRSGDEQDGILFQRGPTMKSTKMSLGMAAVLLLLSVDGLGAQKPEITFAGQVRPRLESRAAGRDTRETFTSMRVRAQLQAIPVDGTRIFIQLQDVRMFGEEANTLGDFSADAFDLHQGYVELGFGTGHPSELRIGRQAMALGEERLVGAVEWTQQGRSFDGARFTATSLGPLTLDLFAMKVQEESSETWGFDGDFLGAYGTVDLRGGGSLDLYTLLTRDSREEGTEEHTLGALWKGAVGFLDLRIEGSLQGGERNGDDVSAWMVGARVGMVVHEKATVTLWYDHLSGDADPNDSEVRVFNTLFATNHAFYGAADYFLDIPAHTGGLGLRDAAVKLDLGPWGGTSVQADIHAFSSAEKGALSTRSLAREVDFSLNHRIGPGLTAVAGLSLVQVRGGMRELGRLEDDANWGFLMLNAVF
jgi:hypothetical protein